MQNLFFIISDLNTMGIAFLKKGSFSIKPVFKSYFFINSNFKNTLKTQMQGGSLCSKSMITSYTMQWEFTKL